MDPNSRNLACFLPVGVSEAMREVPRRLGLQGELGSRICHDPTKERKRGLTLDSKAGTKNPGQ